MGMGCPPRWGVQAANPGKIVINPTATALPVNIRKLDTCSPRGCGQDRDHQHGGHGMVGSGQRYHSTRNGTRDDLPQYRTGSWEGVRLRGAGARDESRASAAGDEKM